MVKGEDWRRNGKGRLFLVFNKNYWRNRDLQIARYRNRNGKLPFLKREFLLIPKRNPINFAQPNISWFLRFDKQAFSSLNTPKQTGSWSLTSVEKFTNETKIKMKFSSAYKMTRKRGKKKKKQFIFNENEWHSFYKTKTKIKNITLKLIIIHYSKHIESNIPII